MKYARWIFPTIIFIASHAQTSSNASEATKVPIIDGAAGPCSVQVTVTGADAKPIYAAKVNVHIAYGFGGFRRLDLDAATNIDGKVKFTGLPNRVKHPPLEFNASKDDLQAVATVDPATECQATRNIVVAKTKP